MQTAPKPLLLVISQVYVPDPASVGQHLADVAEAMVLRGYDVRVLTSRRGYENSREKYPRRERRAEVDIQRLSWSSFGKSSLAHRLFGQGMFMVQVIVRGIVARRLSKILVSTSPPMAAFAALAIASVRRVPISYWVMDLNPDQAVALDKVKSNGWPARLMKWLNRRIFAQAAQVIVLDRFMAERIRKQYKVHGQLEILPPWPHEDVLEVPDGANRFQAQYNPDGKFVVMYSGNHSPASPVTTLVQAAIQMRDDPRFLFMFIGGGQGKREVEEAIRLHRPRNMLSLPYQPLERIRYSLRTADIHMVTLGNNMGGIIHPCKIYGAMSVGRAIVYIGPPQSYATDLLERFRMGWHIEHNAVDRVLEALRAAIAMPPSDRAEMGQRGYEAISNEFSKRRLCSAFCDVIERPPAPPSSEPSSIFAATCDTQPLHEHCESSCEIVRS